VRYEIKSLRFTPLRHCTTNSTLFSHFVFGNSANSKNAEAISF
jgi:hypothetical protein